MKSGEKLDTAFIVGGEPEREQRRKYSNLYFYRTGFKVSYAFPYYLFLNYLLL